LAACAPGRDRDPTTLFGFADAFMAKRHKIDCVPKQAEALLVDRFIEAQFE